MAVDKQLAAAYLHSATENKLLVIGAGLAVLGVTAALVMLPKPANMNVVSLLKSDKRVEVNKDITNTSTVTPVVKATTPPGPVASTPLPTTDVAKLGKALGNPAAIRKWIDANIKYEFYYNHKYSAAEMLKKKKGNCMDQATLFIEMCKAAGYSAKMKCGLRCNLIRHCNALVSVGGVWKTADTTCSKLNKV